MCAHRPHKPRIRRLSPAHPAILERKGDPADLTLTTQDLPRGCRHEAMARFTVPENLDRGTSAHPPGSRPGRWTPSPPGEHRARHPAPQAPTHPGSSPACGRPATSEHDQTCRDPVERVRADRTVPRSDAGGRPVHAPRPGRRRPPVGEGVARRAAVEEVDHLRSPHGGYGTGPVRTPHSASSAIAPSRHGVMPAPTKATPLRMPGVTVTEGAQPRGTVRVSGRSPTGAGRRSPARPRWAVLIPGPGSEGTRIGKDPGPKETRRRPICVTPKGRAPRPRRGGFPMGIPRSGRGMRKRTCPGGRSRCGVPPRRP